MKIRPEQLDIPAEKITEYLLAKKEKNDKSKFLLSLGYSLLNWQDLLNDKKTLLLIMIWFWKEKVSLGIYTLLKVN